ncbi:uncharacterized protein LOC144876191 [Branchiostoma floridae x Branchiostoma japonicum]
MTTQQKVEQAQVTEAGRIRGYIFSRMCGLVLSIKGDNTKEDAEIIIMEQNYAPPKGQLWTYDQEKKTFTSDLTPFQVLSIKDAMVSSDTPIVNETWTGSDYQKWILEAPGIIKSVLNDSYVMKLKDDKGEPGTQVVLYPKGTDPKPSMMWDIHS